MGPSVVAGGHGIPMTGDEAVAHVQEFLGAH
jgi:hypothetical protein